MPNYNDIVIDFQEEIDRLTRVRDNADKQIVQLTAAIASIQTIAEGTDQPIIEPPKLSDDEVLGFTDQIRGIFKANPAQPFTATMIRDLLIERDPNLNPRIALIHTHNTLKRLIKQDEISETQLPNGRVGYRFKPAKLAPVVDLMAALKQSLSEQKDRKENAAEEFRPRLGTADPLNRRGKK